MKLMKCVVFTRVKRLIKPLFKRCLLNKIIFLTFSLVSPIQAKNFFTWSIKDSRRLFSLLRGKSADANSIEKLLFFYAKKKKRH